MATLSNLMTSMAAVDQQRDDVSDATHPTAPVKGDYFFLFENQVENRFAKPRREPRRKRIFRRFTGRNMMDWRRGNHSSTRSMLLAYESNNNSPDTTALISEDEHSLIHSQVSEHNNDEELLSTTTSERNRPIIWPETLSLVGSTSPSASKSASRRNGGRKHKVSMKRLKSRMKTSLKDVLTKSQDTKQAPEVTVNENANHNDDDDKSTATTVSLLERAKRSLAGVSSIPTRGIQRAKAFLHDKEEIGLYVNPDDDEVETVFQSTFDELLIPDFSPNELCNGPPGGLAETVSLDNLYGVAQLMHQGPTSLSVNYDSDFVQPSTSTEVYSVSSRRLGAAPPCEAVQEQLKQKQALDLPKGGEHESRLGISCPAYATKSTLEDAADVWQRIYAPPTEAPPSPTIVQKSRATWGCGLDASPVSVHSDITESDAVVATAHNPFYNIRRYATCGVVQEEEEHPFDEVDSNACAPRATRARKSTRTTLYGCGVPELVRSINLSHKAKTDRLLGHDVLTNEETASSARPRCECVKCSVTNMYANLLAKK